MSHCDEVRLETRLGPLIGSVEGAGAHEVHAFKGIPYAVPPLGARRWRAAERAAGWGSTRNARVFAPGCVQPVEAEGTFYFRPQEVQSEDCLYLNIWTPADRDRGGLPVMVWIHGGSFTMGSGSMPAYDGAALARKGVVLVTINYRLGIFGYFTHSELVDEAAKGGACANFGTTDQIEALAWIQDNIADFGGDPGRITIFGESAGALSVSQLMATPLARGLFHRAIGSSGAYFFPMPYVGSASASGGPAPEELGAAFGVEIGAPGIDALRELPATSLLAATRSEAGAIINGGVLIPVDGRVFHESIHETFARGAQAPMPVIVGYTSDEASGIADYGLIPAFDRETYEAQVRRLFGPLAGDFLALYPSSDPVEAALSAYRDDMFGWGMVEWAARVAAAGQEAYLFSFQHAPPGADAPWPFLQGAIVRKPGAFHAADLGYAFDNLRGEFFSIRGDGVQHDYTVSGRIRAEDRELAAVMSGYFVSFAKEGRPSVQGSPEWKPYSQERRDYLRLAWPPGPANDLAPGMWDFWSKVYAARRSSGITPNFFTLGLHSEPLTS